MNLTQLVETTKGQQFVISMTWNNKEGAVEHGRLVDLFQSLREVFLNTLDSGNTRAQSPAEDR